MKPMTLNDAIGMKKWDVVRALLKMDPDSAKNRTFCRGFFDGRKASNVLPIHHACKSDPPLDVIDTLIASFDKGGLDETESAYERLPLHIVCRSGASLGVVMSLLSCYPEAAEKTDKMKRLPLHYALHSGANTEVIEYMLSHCPESARKPDVSGWLPLHVACSVNPSVRAVKSLLDAFPDAATMANANGETALDILDQSSCLEKSQIERMLEGARYRVLG